MTEEIKPEAINRSQTNVSDLLLLYPEMPFCKLHVETWCSPYKGDKCLTTCAFLGHCLKDPTSHSHPGAVWLCDLKWHKALTRFLILIHFTVPSVKAVSWACTVFLCGGSAVPPASKQSDVTDTCHSYWWYKACRAVVKATIVTLYHFVGFYLSSCGQVCLLAGGYERKETSTLSGT